MGDAAGDSGFFYEDFAIGDVLVTGRRTITATDIVNFASLSGDFNDVHCNHEFCKTMPFGEPIAHGTLVFAMMSGLHHALGINRGAMALLGIEKWRIEAPVKHGDTLFSRSIVVDKRATSKPDRGIVSFRREFVNQRDQVVQQMETSVMYRRRPAP